MPPPVGNNGSGAFGTGLEQSNPLNNLPLTIRGGNPFDASSLTAKPLIRFDFGTTVGLNIDPSLPYFLELTTQTDANSNDTFRINSITDPSTRNFDEATLTWDNAPVAATSSFQDFEAAGDEVGIFFRPNSIDVAGTSIAHPMLGSQLNTFSSGGNTMATFGLSSTQTNRWVTTDQNSPKPPRLITYDVIETAGSGTLTGGGAWVGLANQTDTLYRVGNGHTVSIDGGTDFLGQGVVVGTGADVDLPGDYDDNGIVEPSDYDTWVTAFGSIVSPAGSGADGNANGIVDAADFTVWRNNLGASSAPRAILEFTANDVDVPLIVLNRDGRIRNQTGGSLSIGDPNLSNDQVHAGGAVGQTINGTAGGLIIAGDWAYAATAGAEDLYINVPLIGYGEFTFTGVASSDLNLRFPAGHRGTIRFNGEGDEVVISEDEGIGGVLQMNASGTNTLVFNGRDSEQEQDKGTVVFQQPGTIDHRGDDDNLQGIGNVVANAPADDRPLDDFSSRRAAGE